jgi:nodulation protein E
VTKVVITGMGCVSGLGRDRASAWRTLMAGEGGIRPLKKYAQGQQELSFDGIGAAVPPDAMQGLAAHFAEKQLSGVDAFSSFAAAATLEALQDAGLWGPGSNGSLSQAAIVYGSASGGNASIEAAFERMFYERLPNVHPMTIPRYMSSAGVSHLSMLFGIRGPCHAISSACSSSAHAIQEGMHLIRARRASIVITGGSDASLTFGSLHGWKALQAMAPDACRPFSIDRKGMVLGEGAATLILEDEEHALGRGAHIHAELAGAGSTADAAHITQPDAQSAAAAILTAHRDADLKDDASLLISTHGTGTRVNDRSEAAALRIAYPASLGRHRVIATKSAHGHMLGATGAMELLIAIEAMNARVAPPILGFLGRDPECDLPLVLTPEPIDCEAIVSASFAFGGLNCVLVAKRQ